MTNASTQGALLSRERDEAALGILREIGLEIGGAQTVLDRFPECQLVLLVTVFGQNAAAIQCDNDIRLIFRLYH